MIISSFPHPRETKKEVVVGGGEDNTHEDIVAKFRIQT